MYSTRAKEKEIKHVIKVHVLVCVWLLNTEASHKEWHFKLCSHALLIYTCILMSASVYANVSKRRVIRRQCKWPVCKHMHASRTLVHCKQNTYKLCACTCKQVLACNLHCLTLVHLGQIYGKRMQARDYMQNKEFLYACNMLKLL